MKDFANENKQRDANLGKVGAVALSDNGQSVGAFVVHATEADWLGSSRGWCTTAWSFSQQVFSRMRPS